MFTEPERLALAGFLGSYAGLTRQAYTLALRQYASWCQQRRVALFAARRADIESFARDLEARGRARVDGLAAAGHDCRVLQVRRAGRHARSLTCRARPPAAAGL